MSVKESLVSESREEMQSMINRTSDKLLHELSCIRQQKQNELEMAESENGNKLVMMESFKRYCQEVIQKATPAEVSCLLTIFTPELMDYVPCQLKKTMIQ